MSARYTMPDNVDEYICREARYVVDLQIDKNVSYDRKAVRLFRSNLLLIGLLLTGISLTLTLEGVDTSQFINIWGVLGLAALVSSAFISAIAYTSSSFDLGVSSEYIAEVGDGDYSESDELLADLGEKYQKWIDRNNSVGTFNAVLLTLAVILAINAIVLLIGGTLVGIYTAKYTNLSLILVVITLLGLLIIDLVIWFSEEIFLMLSSLRNDV